MGQRASQPRLHGVYRWPRHHGVLRIEFDGRPARWLAVLTDMEERTDLEARLMERA